MGGDARRVRREHRAPIHAAALAPKTRIDYTGLYDRTSAQRWRLSAAATSLRRSSAAGRPTGSPPAPRASAPAKRSRSWAGSFSARSRRSGTLPTRSGCPQGPAEARDEVRPLAPITVERIRQALLAGAGRDGASTRTTCWRCAIAKPSWSPCWPTPDCARRRCVRCAGPRAGAHAGRSRSEDAAPPSPAAHRAAARPARAGPPRVAASRGDPGTASRRPCAGRLGDWTENAFEMWRRPGHERATLKTVKTPYQHPYVLRHSFASLLLHEGARSSMSRASSATAPQLTM